MPRPLGNNWQTSLQKRSQTDCVIIQARDLMRLHEIVNQLVRDLSLSLLTDAQGSRMADIVCTA